MATQTKKTTVKIASKRAPRVKSEGNENEVTIRHGLFRYHRAFEDEVGNKRVKILHAERNETVFVNDEDYARGMEHGAFYTTGASRKKTVAEEQTRTDKNDQANADTNEEFDFDGASDEAILEYMERHDADEIIVKTQGIDDDLTTRVLGLEYMRTNGNPNPQIKDQLVDILGSNPEEDEDGNWVNEDKKAKVQTESEKQQSAARKGAGRKATGRSGGKSTGSKAN